MANTTSNKLPIQKNVVYDSGNDITTGRKRAVDFTGGVSVAERARLFGTQITHSSATKNPQSQRPTVNKQQQPIKSNVIHQDRNYQPYRTNANRYPKQDTTYTSPERVSHNYQPPSPIQIDERPKREPSPLINSQNYSTATRPPHRYHQQQQQQPFSMYDTFQSRIKREQPSIKTNYTQVIPGESYTYDDDPFYQSYQSQQSLPSQSNYFQPIRDPLEALYRSSAPIYSQQQMPMAVNNNNNNNTLDGMQAFDLGNLINRIQQDYLNNVRPYVSSVQFVEDDQNLANIGVITPSTRRKDYSRRNNDIYLRQGASYHYDIIDMNGLYPRFTKPSYDDKHYSSIKRRRHRRRYHDRALSPIHIFESSNKPQPPASPPAAPIEKPATPVVASSSEEEEEDTTAANTKTEEAKTSSESEEDVIVTPSKPSTEIQSNEITRPILPNQTPSTAARLPAKPVASVSSESEESDSDSDSDSDGDDEEEDEKPKPAPAARSNNTRTTPATPQTNTRVVPLRTTTNNSDITNQPPDTSHSVNSFDLETSKKSSAISRRFRSIFNKIRRKKS